MEEYIESLNALRKIRLYLTTIAAIPFAVIAAAIIKLSPELQHLLDVNQLEN